MGFGQWLAFRTFSIVDPLVVWEVMLATCAIAFGGYVINDFYDQKIDEVNRPGRNLFVRTFFKKYGVLVYTLANLIGLVLGAIISWEMLVLNTICASLLFAYSALFKRVAVLGNLLVASMQALVFAPVFLVESFRSWGDSFDFSSSAIPGLPISMGTFDQLFLIGIVCFAFLTGWIREWAKDMEDVSGDRGQGARTAAVIWPLEVNKHLIAALCVVLVLGVAFFTINLYVGSIANTKGVLSYYFLFLLFPIAIRAFVMVQKVKEQGDWTKLSQWVKMIMLAGILAMGVA